MVYCFNVMAGSDYILRRFMFYYMEYSAISYIAKSNLLKSSTSFLVVMVTQIGVQKPIRMFDCKHFFKQTTMKREDPVLGASSMFLSCSQ